jgi:hypothetical protein
MVYGYDPIRKVTWIFAGHESPTNPLNGDDLWSWDGRVWVKHLPPPGRSPSPAASPPGIST